MDIIITQEDFGDNMNNEYIVGNRGGIVYTNATQTDAGSSTTNAIYTLPNHVFRFLGSVGLIVVNMSSTATSVTGITISVNNQSLPATDNKGNAITTLNSGDYILFFNKQSNTIKFFI